MNKHVNWMEKEEEDTGKWWNERKGSVWRIIVEKA